MLDTKIYTLSELSSLVEEAIMECMPETYLVQAEIASLSEKGGHLYLDLVEKADRGLMAARMRATCWQSRWAMLRAYFEQETGMRLQAGMQVLVEVEVQYHAVYGLSLSIINIDPRYTLGDLARQRQETIRQLTDDGVMDMQRAMPLPTLVRRVAVISSGEAAGYGDFAHQLADSPYRFTTSLFPATMQGERAEQSILAALDAVYAQLEDFDALVIIRGGGATTDLSCFDQYALCAHCAQFPLPILTGIGHTRDVSVLDMVAHMALKTPTAVAAWLIERMDAQSKRIDDLLHRLAQTATRQVLIRQHRVELLEQRLAACSPERIYRMGYSLLTSQGKVVRSIHDVEVGQSLITHLQDGEIESKVTRC
ncbi:MAG: exodeoxyribonuclease VII large subunit [Paludibacteraceae bacterium]|nr:exodeoxyribonuclease VII large subunit [Paludibacteraceae bacterium]